jgi:hypothetical protein
LLDREHAGVREFLEGLNARGTAGIAAHVREALEILDGAAELGSLPADLLDVLVDFALGSPAIVWARTLSGFGVSDGVRRELAAAMAEAFRSLFNDPSVVSLLQREPGGRYWHATLRYATSGNLQAVLDEYAHLLWEPEAWAEKGPDETARVVTQSAAAALTTKTSIVRPEYYHPGSDGIVKVDQGTALRTQFALRYGNLQSGTESQDVREDAVRDAFKSPFYPFVLASTSVGQEGLDFHPWCHSVWHWNLPGNPVDLEQREGAQLERLKRSLAIYRVVFGQPRQSELVQLLDGGTWSPEEMDRWVVRLEV